MSEKLNLYQKIVKVRQVADSFSKDASGYGYSYVSGNQVLLKIKDKMNELNLLLIPSTTVGEHHTHAYKTSKGKDALDFIVKGNMTYTWINGDVPEEREVVSWAYYGQQDEISKAYGSGLTYSERYFLLKCLGLPTDEDDPDAKPKRDYKTSNSENKSTNNNEQTRSNDSHSSGNGFASEGQTRMLYAKYKATGWLGFGEVINYIGYEITKFAEVRAADVTKLAQYLDKNKVA
ncbi:ERF family protein [Paenibacillus sp. Lou8.1]|uniref:ERF family protein n=1 Tax=Paenibacillus sp. Lou8.1 TaxID=2962041 RepID=UPI0020B75AE3|nr:ERF family protein [Paenibacillus sp. Lou8.1]MCP3810037.1 ERF family protein [Paenibacillus sp. Lou8.1]